MSDEEGQGNRVKTEDCEDKEILKRENIVLLILIICLQIAGTCFLCNHVHAGGDAIFTFTLANTPYEFNYIDNKLDKFPSENGWFSADILREQYMAMPYNRFNYSGVYWHQRLDNHPLLYYSLVHTFCSLFPDSYSIWYALIINVMALLLIDVILIRIGRLLFRERYAGAVLILTSMMMVVFYGMVSLARMYMLLALICLWFLYISLRIAKEMQVSMPEILLCVFLGSQTHYYFYVYAAVTGLIILMILLVKKRWKELLKILTAASMGEFLSLILFPWVVWHIVFNQMDKNESLYVWSQQQVRDYICFLNQTVFNGRGSIWICFTVMTALLAAFLARKGRVQWMPAEGKIAWLVIAPGTLIYSILIFTLNGAVDYYAMPVYLPVCILMTSVVITFIRIAGELFRGIKRRTDPLADKKSELLRGAMSILIMALLTNGVVKLNERFSYSCMDDRQYCRMHQVAEEYQGADCLYVASAEDNLLQGMWFEFGNYGKFKRLREVDYCRIVRNTKNGWNSILRGHDSEKPVVLYLPNTLELPGNARLIDETDDFLIAILNG